MDKLFIRKDVYEELLEKGFGKKDYSKLTKKVITDKNGHKRTVFVKNDVEQTEQKQPKAQEGLTPEKKARYEEMLEQVKAGSDENALFVRGKGMLNKKDAIAHLEGKLGKKPVNSAAVGHLEADEPQNTDITAEDEKRFGKEALSGLSGKRTGSDETKTYKASEIERVDKNTLKLGNVTATKERDNSWTIKNGKGEKVATALYMDVVKNAMVRSANWKSGNSKYPSISREDKISMVAKQMQNKYGGGGTTIESWKESLQDLPEETLEYRFEEYADKHQDEIENYLDAKNEAGKNDAKAEIKAKAAENKKEIDRLMKIGFDRRSAYAKVALDAITDRLDVEKDKSIREKLFEDMRDVQLNGLNAKYFETHKDEYGF